MKKTGRLKTPDQLHPIKVHVVDILNTPNLQPCKSVILNQDFRSPFPFTIFFLQDGVRLRKQQVKHMDQAVALMCAWCTDGELLKPLNYSTRRDGSAWAKRNG